MQKRLIKLGNSCALTLPAEEVARLKLKPGDQVEVSSDGNALKIVPVRKIKAVALGGLFKGVEISEEDIREVRKEMWREPFR